MAILTAQQLDVAIGTVQVCAQLDLKLQPGQRWGVLGRNGAGNTTLLHTPAGRRAPRNGAGLLDRPLLPPQPSHDGATQAGALTPH